METLSNGYEEQCVSTFSMVGTFFWENNTPVKTFLALKSIGLHLIWRFCCVLQNKQTFYHHIFMPVYVDTEQAQFTPKYFKQSQQVRE